MSGGIASALLVASGLLTSAAASAPPAAIEEKAVQTGAAKLDPQRGYIFLHAPYRFQGMFLKVPDEADRASYQADWDEAFAKAQKNYARQLARWRTDVSLAQRVKKEPPAKPEEPTRENFTIGPIEARDAASFGPMYVFNKADKRFSYLTSVRPGTYIWYGTVMVVPAGGAAGTCACMGTVRFEVKPGAVTNLGNFLLAATTLDRNNDVMTMEAWQRAEEKAAKNGKPLDPGLLAKPALDYTLPASLSGWPSAQAQFSASPKLNNFYGVLVSRLPPIPGVLAYRRDKVIDVRTDQELSNGPIVSMQKPKR